MAYSIKASNYIGQANVNIVIRAIEKSIVIITVYALTAVVMFPFSFTTFNRIKINK